MFFFAFICAMWLSTRKVKQTGSDPIRKIAGLDAITEAIGRATELGRPVHFTLGRGFFDAEHGAQTFEGLSMLKHVALTAARYGCRLIVTNQSALQRS